jgi:uncharacterized protein
MHLLRKVITKVFCLFAPTIQNGSFIGDQTLNGKENVREWMKTAYKQPPSFEVENIIAEDDFVTAIGKITMKNEKEIMTTYSYCDVWKFRDGKMAELRAFVIEAQS